MHTRTHGEFVGRDQELRDLHDALGEARAGRGRAILIGGEPGIGKSRLAAELAAHAADVGCLSLWGRGWEDAGAPAYWPWIQALRMLIRATPHEDLKRFLGSGLADVAQVLPELDPMFDAIPRKSGADSDSARFQLFDSTANLLRAAAAEMPLLIVLDDLHAADTPSILLLRFIASQLNDMAVLVVGTYRDLELTPEHPLTNALGEMGRERATRLMMLGGLGSDAVSEYISATANIEPDGLTVAAVWRETNGNPLFVGEAVRLLASEGRLNEVGDRASFRLAVPAGVRAVIARRIGHLSPEAGRALTVGAVIGPEFSLDVLRRIGEPAADRVADAVNEAASAGLLSGMTGGPGRFRFSHDLVRETLYEQIPIAERAHLHHLAGNALERGNSATFDGHLAQLAFHFGQAVLLGESDMDGADAHSLRDKAVEYARRAGIQASRSLAYEEAREHYRLALAVLDVDPEASSEDRVELLLALGDTCVRSGDLDRGRVAFLDAAASARELDAGTVFARAVLGYGGRHQWVRAGSDHLLIPLLEEAIVRLGDLDDRLRLRLLTRLSGAWRSDPAKRVECARLSQEAIDLARRMDDPASLGYALAGRFWATWWPEDPQERDALSTEIAGLAESINDDERVAEAHLMKVLSLFELGRLDEARQQVAGLTELLRQTRQPPHLWLAPVSRVELALFEGDYDLAEQLIPEEFRHRVTPARDDVSAARMHRFLLRREQGRLAEEEKHVRLSVSDFPWYPLHKAALCCLLIDLDRTDEARTVFRDLAVNEFSAIYRDNEWLLGMSLAANACALLGDEKQARILYEQLAPFSGRLAIGHVEGAVGVVDTYLGQLAATMGEPDVAERHLNAAIAQLDEQGGRPWLAHAQHDLAQVLRQRGRHGDAERAGELNKDALRVADELHMVLAGEIRRAVTFDNPTNPSRGANVATVSSATFHREGDYWAVEFGAESFRLRDSKGMHHLARLLQSPGIEMHALDLVRSDGSPMGSNHSLHDQGLQLGDPSDTGPLLDTEAKAAYRERLRSIDQDLAEAERWNDPGRTTVLEDEREALMRELAAAVGLGNRDRTSAASSAERARVSVTRAIRAAMDRIDDYSSTLGSHLDATIRTGTFCAYVPDPRAPIEWEV